MARIQERSIYGAVAWTSFSQALESYPTAITTNREGTQVAVAGRHLLKIYNIEEKGFVERVTLVSGHRKLNYSITDVQWHPIEENHLATAAGNGAVILWDLAKVNEQKQEMIFQEHNRFVHKICFHPSDAALLMSCAQDGTMNCFDIRKKEAVMTFIGKADSIRDVQFHPSERNCFAAACDSGNVQLWDLRKPEHYNNQFTAHTGPVYALHWHPEDRHWLATGGRDSCIKVWDVQSRGQPVYTVQTIASVGRIRWRPKERYHIASCSLILDNNVNIWDIRRPYIPFAAFEAHKNVVTGILWQRDPDVMLSCSKDQTIWQHVMSDAERPASKSPPVALSLSPNGSICHAYPGVHLKKVSALSKATPPPQTPAFFKKTANFPDEFHPTTSTLYVRSARDLMDESSIELLAKELKFFGKSFSELCDHNAKVCESHGFHVKAATWEILKLTYSMDGSLMSHVSNQNPLPSPLSINSTANHLQRLDPSAALDNMNQRTGISSEDENGSATDDTTAISEFMKGKSNILNLVGQAELEAVFGEDQSSNRISGEMQTDDTQDWLLPIESIQLRRIIADKPDLDVMASEDTEGEAVVEKRNDTTPEHFVLELPDWDFKELIRDVLYFYAEQGDIQMSVAIMLVLQDKGVGLIDDPVLEDWFQGYVDILHRLRLWNIATEVITHSQSAAVRSLNQNSTTIHVMCGHCSKNVPLDPPTWSCPSCANLLQTCSLCHTPVKGLYVWCQGCGHGGHLLHLKTWFQDSRFCPAGCGHKCEYS